MKQELITKIQNVYQDAKKFASNYDCPEVMLNNAGNKEVDVWNEYAKQINYTNKFREKRKGLNLILTILVDYKNGVDNNTPAGRKILSQVNGYIENIKTLLKVYVDIEAMQWDILNYYNRGGGCQW